MGSTYAANTRFNQADVTRRLMDKGFNPEKAATMADAITARLNGQELTRQQTDRLRSAMDNAVVRDVMADITKKQADGIDRTKRNGYDKTEGNENRHEAVTEDAAPHQNRNAFSEGSYEHGSDVSNHLKPQNLMDELASSGVKYTPDEVIAVTKTPDGHLLWLEQGNAKSGLTHILERHAADFASQGVDDIPQLLSNVVKSAPIK